MDTREIRTWLDEQWQRVLQEDGVEIDPEINHFVDSHVASIRFAIFTQLLGKIADPRRDLICLQRGDARPGVASGGARWDPRSFCVAVVVPWNNDNERVLGGSQDPYVSNPLRRPRLDKGLVNVRAGDRDNWQALVGYLGNLQSAHHDEIINAFVKCLQCVAVRLQQQRIDYPTPNRVSLDQMCQVLDFFLATPSGGLRSQIVATALMRVLGDAFSIFSRVEGQGLNEADRARNMPGDIMCYHGSGRPENPEEVRLVVEVKSGSLRLVELQGSILKARTNYISNFLLATPGVHEDDKDTVDSAVHAEFVQGLNVYVTSIGDIVRSTFMLLAEERRTEFLNEIGRELDDRAAPLADRSEWFDILAGCGG